MAPSSQISPLRHARFADVTLQKCCGNRRSTASGSGHGGLPAGYNSDATTSKSSRGLMWCVDASALLLLLLLLCASSTFTLLSACIHDHFERLEEKLALILTFV